MNDTLVFNDEQYRSAEQINSAMGRVYGHMSLAVVVSMLISYWVGTTPELLQFFFTGIMKWIVIFAPLAAIFGVSMVLGNNPSKPMAQLCLHGFAALMGLSFSMIFAVFAMGSIVSAFMGAAILFGVMSGYGYFTKRINLEVVDKTLKKTKLALTNEQVQEYKKLKLIQKSCSYTICKQISNSYRLLEFDRLPLRTRPKALKMIDKNLIHNLEPRHYHLKNGKLYSNSNKAIL